MRKDKYNFLEIALRKLKKVNAKSTGNVLFIAPSGFFKRIRLLVALWILPRETLVVVEPHQEAKRDTEKSQKYPKEVSYEP